MNKILSNECMNFGMYSWMQKSQLANIKQNYLIDILF